MRLPVLPQTEYDERVKRIQIELQKEGRDVLVGYSSECESAATRFLTSFWSFFDFAGVVVPAEGKAVLVTGGPESLEFAKYFFGEEEEMFEIALTDQGCLMKWLPKYIFHIQKLLIMSHDDRMKYLKEFL